jgi:hypothetical protein
LAWFANAFRGADLAHHFPTNIPPLSILYGGDASGALCIPTIVEERNTMPQSKRSHRKAVAGISRESRLGKSPAEFCEAYGISRSTFEEWRRRGLGPAELQPIAGGRIVITQEAEDAWKAKHSALAAVIDAAE